MAPAGATRNCGDHHGTCAIDDCRWSIAGGAFPGLEREAARDTDGVRIRRCEGEGDTPKLAGTAGGRIQGQAFEATGRVGPPIADGCRNDALSGG